MYLITESVLVNSVIALKDECKKTEVRLGKHIDF